MAAAIQVPQRVRRVSDKPDGAAVHHDSLRRHGEPCVRDELRGVSRRKYNVSARCLLLPCSVPSHSAALLYQPWSDFCLASRTSTSPRSTRRMTRSSWHGRTSSTFGTRARRHRRVRFEPSSSAPAPLFPPYSNHKCIPRVHAEPAVVMQITLIYWCALLVLLFSAWPGIGSLTSHCLRTASSTTAVSSSAAAACN